MSVQLFDIQYLSPLDDIESENDNIDVHDGRWLEIYGTLQTS